jgi:hypothetical protein
VRVLAQIDAADEVEHMIQEWMDASQTRGMVQRNLERLAAGRGPEMLPGVVPDVIIHSVVVHGPTALAAAGELVRRLGTGTGGFDGGRYMAAWTMQMHRDGVLLALPRGAIPAVVEGVRYMAATFLVSVMIVGGMVILGGVTLATVDPILEGTTAGRWLGGVHLPVRLLWEPEDRERPHEAWIRLAAADRGHDLQWLIDTGGDLEAYQVARALGDQIGAMVTAAPVNAMHPDTEEFSDMVAVRTSTDRAATVRAMVASGTALLVEGRRCAMYPLTVVRTSVPRINRRPRQTERVAMAARSVAVGAAALGSRAVTSGDEVRMAASLAGAPTLHGQRQHEQQQ